MSAVDLFFRIAFGCAWGAMVLVWAWGWRISKPTSRRAEGLNGLTPFLPVLIGVVLLKVHVLPESWIKEPLWPHSAITDEPPVDVAAAGHDRCIINLKSEHVDAWLTPQARSPKELEGIVSDRAIPVFQHEVLKAA